MDRARWVKFTKFTLAWALAGAFLFFVLYLFTSLTSFPSGNATFEGQVYIAISILGLNLPALLMGTIISSDVARSVEVALMLLANVIGYAGIGALYWVIRNKKGHG